MVTTGSRWQSLRKTAHVLSNRGGWTTLELPPLCIQLPSIYRHCPDYNLKRAEFVPAVYLKSYRTGADAPYTRLTYPKYSIILFTPHAQEFLVNSIYGVFYFQRAISINLTLFQRSDERLTSAYSPYDQAGPVQPVQDN